MGSSRTRREVLLAAGSVATGSAVAGCVGDVREFASGATGSWQSGSLPAEDVGVYGLTFVDESRGWMAVGADDFGNGGGFYRTDDGGRSWTRSHGDDARAVAVARDGSRVYGFETAGSDFFAWYADGGEDWRPIENDAFSVTETVDDAVFFTDAVGVAAPITGRRVKRTTDGGGEFRQQDLEHCSVNDLTAVGDSVILVGNTDAGEPNEGGCLMRSDARGEPGSWELKRFSDEAHDYAGGAMTGVYAPSPEEVWVVGRNRQLFHTTDGGESWTQRSGIDDRVASFSAIDGAGDRIAALALDSGSAGGQGGLVYESSDSGETWEVTWTAPEGSKVSFDDLAFAAPDRALAYSEFGDVLEFTGR